MKKNMNKTRAILLGTIAASTTLTSCSTSDGDDYLYEKVNSENI